MKYDHVYCLYHTKDNWLFKVKITMLNCGIYTCIKSHLQMCDMTKKQQQKYLDEKWKLTIVQ